jgi:hypothetical protein
MTLVVDNCRFGDAPRHEGPMLRHLLYVGAIGWCVVMNSRFHNGWRGHLLKSRARVDRILWNELVDRPGDQAANEPEFARAASSRRWATISACRPAR